ncbi:hypothetical protein EGY25_04510 [Brevundimonas intermedia]|uniref:Uncharacterized protein n=1 Tax=Brevundimonas intermedia TaxID=74315 RepID=A0A4Y9RZ80_9CAUL|nr:hypothetical protein [Brevundimonas intermedia]TFW14460.1 hypothetical protein EGY25_04510 [Brevundimonas intermedia]
MTRFLTPALIAAALAAAATPSLAQQSLAQQSPAQQTQARETVSPAALRAVMACKTDTATRRAYQREFGAAPVFVTAQEAVAARENGQRWSTPRCMTEHQYNRLVASTQTRASL